MTAGDFYTDERYLNVLFAGDIMAHKPNFSRGHFNEIYSDIKGLLQESDLAVANIETPVTDSLDYSSYPFFNVHTEYVQAAVDAGFNTFSLANNHTNDQNLEGIKSTSKVASSMKKRYASSSRPVYFSGLRSTEGGPYSYEVIDVKGFKVLFISITQILNQKSFSSWINYVPDTKASRQAFIDYIRDLRHNVSCDLFIVGVHSDVTEYVLDITDAEKDFFHGLIDAGADVVWANHAHVAKGWEVLADEEGIPRKAIFYSMGNTISGQRWEPDFEDPSDPRDYTGDGYLCQVRFVKDSKGIRIYNVNPILITTYITPQWYFEIRVLDGDFIQRLRQSGLKKWASYLEERMKLMEQIKGTLNGNRL